MNIPNIMAAEMNSRSNKQGTIAFTLPISCQICLGKVKQPVLCPNCHVFCSPCMDIWLERNQQCPACRVKISKENPCKNILGGLNQCEEDRQRISNPELRKARFELLYKEYESEFDKYHAQVECLKVENVSLKQKLHKKTAGHSGGYHGHRDAGHSDGYHDHHDDMKPQQSIDMDSLMLLTKKLKEATKLYEQLKEGTAAMNQEKNNLKEENVNLVRENKHLRLELVNRSPHRFGRCTVATLESKVESHEKEVAQLNKALERSDKYIEELEGELELYKNKNKTDSEQPSAFQHSDYKSFRSSLNDDNQAGMSANTKHPSKRQLFSSDPETSSIPPSTNPENVNTVVKCVDNKPRNSEGFHKARSQKQLKRVHFNISSGSGESTFDLEGPSPIPVAPSAGGDNKHVQRIVQCQEPAENSGVSMDNSIMESSENTLELPTKVSKNPTGKTSQNSTKQRHESVESGSAFRQESSRTNVQSVVPCNGEAELDDTQVIENELDELNISLTPDFTDCMKLLNRAEKKVHRRSSSSEGAPFTQSAPGRSILNSNSETENDDANMQNLECADEMQKHLASSLPASSIADLPRSMQHVLSSRLHPASGIPSHPSSSHFANTGYLASRLPVPIFIPGNNVGSCDNIAAAKEPSVTNALQFQLPTAGIEALPVVSNLSMNHGTIVQRPALFGHSRLPYCMQPSLTSSTLSFLNMVNGKTNHVPITSMKPAAYFSAEQMYPANGGGINNGLISNENLPDKFSYENFVQPIAELPKANTTNHYYPNISDISNDISSKSDLSFPEPKKRLFDSDSTDLELPSSPMKTSKMN